MACSSVSRWLFSSEKSTRWKLALGEVKGPVLRAVQEGPSPDESFLSALSGSLGIPCVTEARVTLLVPRSWEPRMEHRGGALSLTRRYRTQWSPLEKPLVSWGAISSGISCLSRSTAGWKAPSRFWKINVFHQSRRLNSWQLWSYFKKATKST